MVLLLGSLILAFGLYNIHALSGVSEGGAIGLVLDLKVDHNSVLSNLPIEGITTLLEGVEEGNLALQLRDLLQHNRVETIIAKSTRYDLKI